MSAEYFTLSVNETLNLITVKMVGPAASRPYADKLMETFDRIDHVWTYDRLYDCTLYETTLETDDIERLSRHWAELIDGKEISNHKVAVVSKNYMTLMRVMSTSINFPESTIRIFSAVEEAMSWLKSDKD